MWCSRDCVEKVKLGGLIRREMGEVSDQILGNVIESVGRRREWL